MRLRPAIVLEAGDDGRRRRLGIDYREERLRNSTEVARRILGPCRYPVAPVFELRGNKAPLSHLVGIGWTETLSVTEDLDYTPGLRVAGDRQRCVVCGVVILQPGVVIEPDYHRPTRGNGVDGQGKGLGGVADVFLVVDSGCGQAVRSIRQRVLDNKLPRPILTRVRLPQHAVAPVDPNLQVAHRPARQGWRIVAGDSITLNPSVLREARDDWTLRRSRSGVRLGPTAPRPSSGTGRHQERQRGGQPQNEGRLYGRVEHSPVSRRPFASGRASRHPFPPDVE